MKFRQVIKLVRQKSRLAYVVFILILAITGMYTFYSMLYLQASMDKWRPLERMGEGWYYYASAIVAEESDPADEYIKEHFDDLEVKHVNSFQGYDVFSCSQRAWEMFDYPLEKGDGFSTTDPNEVIVSKDMEHDHPVGSMMEVKIYDTTSFYGKPDPVKTIECKVAGIIKQDEIFFRQPVGSPTLSSRVEKSMFWKSEYGNVSPFQVMHCFLNPRIEIRNPKWYVRSSGTFFYAEADEIGEFRKSFPESGIIYPVGDILKKADPLYWGEGKKRGIKLLLMSSFCVIYLVVWISVILMKNKRDFAYLMYVNDHLQEKERKKENQHYYNRFFRVPFICILPAFLLSFAAYFLPNDVESFWEVRFYMPFIIPGIQFAVCLAGFVILRLINRNYAGRVWDYLENCNTRKLFIDDLSIFDNLVIMLTAKGFSYSWSENYVQEVLAGRTLAYCRKRRADMLSDEERMQINEIKEEILKNEGQL